MNIYVPYGETELSQAENTTIAALVQKNNIERLETPSAYTDYTWLDNAQSMIAGATELTDEVAAQARYVASELGRDVLLLCADETRQKQAIKRLGEMHFSIVFPSRPLWPKVVRNHIVAQQIREGEYGERVANIANRYSTTGARLDKRDRNPLKPLTDIPTWP